MNLKLAFYVGAGAFFGAILRWFLGEKFNLFWPHLPLGTLLANWLGAFLMGILIALVPQTSLSPAQKLMIGTGFLGGLTTFSTFSAELMALLQEGQYGWFSLACIAHVGGSLLFVMIGHAFIASFRS